MHPVHVVMAVKALDRAKSRLAGGLSAQQRARLVLAMLADTIRAARAVASIASITVVTPDSRVAHCAQRLGAEMCREPTSEGHHDLNTALGAGAWQVRHADPHATMLLLQADLPALRPAELSEMLGAAQSCARAFVSDAAGRGTTALVTHAPLPIEPLFGPNSAARHRAAGATELPGAWPGLRVDVDTAADLQHVHALGTGPDTQALLSEINWHTADSPPEKTLRQPAGDR